MTLSEKPTVVETVAYVWGADISIEEATEIAEVVDWNHPYHDQVVACLKQRGHETRDIAQTELTDPEAKPQLVQVVARIWGIDLPPAAASRVASAIDWTIHRHDQMIDQIRKLGYKPRNLWKEGGQRRP